MAKVSTSAPGAASSELQAVAQRLRTWRTTRRPGQRIPEELWRAATELARSHGLSRTTRALQLGYYALRRRLESGRARRSPSPPAPVFMEVAPVPLPPGDGGGGTVEIVQRCGARLILRLPAAGPKELLPLVDLFLRRR